MRIRQIEDNLYISDQIASAELGTLAQLGIRTIVCNRPDGEEAGQPGFAGLQEAARQYDIEMLYIPVTPPAITSDILNEMAAALQQAEHPLLAYCKSGTRSEMLYRLIKQQMAE